jgi:hypothetical protein
LRATGGEGDMREQAGPGVPSRIAIVDIDSTFEALTLRQVIEWLGDVPVDWVGVGRSRHLIRCLRGRGGRAEHLILCCHGDDDGIILPELHPSVAEGEPYLDRFGTEAIRREARLKERTVICTGCSTGRLAEAFLDAGAAAVIAPVGDPHGSAPLVFLTNLYYGLLVLGDDLGAAVGRARKAGGDARVFRLLRSEDHGPEA